jgi:glycyl-tRNA synthetase beta subunit
MEKQRNRKNTGFFQECNGKIEDCKTQEKHKNGHLIGPQEKHRNLRRDKDSKETFHEVLPHVKFPPKLAWNEAFHKNFIGFQMVRSFDSKSYIGKNPIGMKSYKIPMIFH